MYSKTTEKLGLPQWEQGNHPEFIGDMNPAFQKIDEAYGGIAEVGSELPKQVKELQTLTQSQQEDITQLRADLSDAEVKIINLEGNVGTVEALTRRVDLVEANNRVLTERVNKFESERNARIDHEMAIMAKFDSANATVKLHGCYRSGLVFGISIDGNSIKTVMDNVTIAPGSYRCTLTEEQSNEIINAMDISGMSAFAIATVEFFYVGNIVATAYFDMTDGIITMWFNKLGQFETEEGIKRGSSIMKSILIGG